MRRIIKLSDMEKISALESEIEIMKSSVISMDSNVSVLTGGVGFQTLSAERNTLNLGLYSDTTQNIDVEYWKEGQVTPSANNGIEVIQDETRVHTINSLEVGTKYFVKIYSKGIGSMPKVAYTQLIDKPFFTIEKIEVSENSRSYPNPSDSSWTVFQRWYHNGRCTISNFNPELVGKSVTLNYSITGGGSGTFVVTGNGSKTLLSSNWLTAQNNRSDWPAMSTTTIYITYSDGTPLCQGSFNGRGSKTTNALIDYWKDI